MHCRVCSSFPSLHIPGASSVISLKSRRPKTSPGVATCPRFSGVRTSVCELPQHPTQSRKHNEGLLTAARLSLLGGNWEPSQKPSRSPLG